MPVVPDECPTRRIDEHERLLEDVESAIAILHKEAESRLKFELELTKGQEALKKSMDY
jgi:hypothetical protein